MKTTAALSIQHVSKTFNGNTVLKECSLEIMPGTIHGLLGQNGSGKSTLVKILSGFQPPDTGSAVVLDGKPLSFPVSAATIRASGLSFVHQDLALDDEVSILDNLFVGRYGARRGLPIPKKKLKARAGAALQDFGLDLDPSADVSTLTLGEKACVAIVRAFLDVEEHDSPVLVLDEPTARLDKTDVARLFGAVRAAAARGAGVLFISHRLEEILEITDRVTVLREGRVTGRAVTADCDENSLIELILGQEMSSVYPPSHVVPGERVFTLRGLSGKLIHGLDLDIHAGEVIGMTGLPDSGADTVPYLLMGSEPSSASVMALEGVADLTTLSIKKRIDAGVALVPGDRARQGAALPLTVAENVLLLQLPTLRRFGFLSPARQTRRVREAMDEFDIRPRQPDLPMSFLSGGNQQKAVIAKWLATGPKLVVLHEPTQGVDVGARQLIFSLVAELSARGTAVLLVTVEHEDLARLSHRVVVLRGGRIAAELAGNDLSKERIDEEYLKSA